ncbi:MAG TPA: hypothetical protein VKB58_11575 [Terriglobales bacterium]|nr:hypothetical protein [Terriglobales bacterium]
MAPSRISTVAIWFLAILSAAALAGCGGTATSNPPTPPAPLSAGNVNLIFVVSEDLSYAAPGDVNLKTANLTNRGLQRSLRMATFLKQSVLGGNNVTIIHVLTPMTHLQTANNYPDMVALDTVQQFAMLNEITLSYENNTPVRANSYPLNVAYSSARLPDGVAEPLVNCSPLASCQGLDFRDEDGGNEALASAIIKTGTPGYYVFSAPWGTVRALIANLNQLEGYALAVPTSYAGPNYIYAISIAPSGAASLITYDSGVNPSSTYPLLPAGAIVSAPCLPVTTHGGFHIVVTGGAGGAVVPAGINTNETVYLVRHAEAHPVDWWEDGNYIGSGQWRALDLPNALRGKIYPDRVLSIDPAQVTPGSTSAQGDAYSYVRTNATVLPYAIANNLPYQLAANFELLAQNPPQQLATQASTFLFFGGQFSNKRLLVGWEHDHIPPTVNALLQTYHGGQTAPNWPDDDFDTVWTVKLDEAGNLSVDNATCEGIKSSTLPATPPQF